MRAIDRPHPYEIFNLGKGNGTSLKEFIGLVEKHTGKKAMICQLPDQPGDVPYTCADVGKAQRLLGYCAKVSFSEGIRLTAKWYQGTYGFSTLKINHETTDVNKFERADSYVGSNSVLPIQLESKN